MFRLDGKVAVVIGGGGGIGKVLALGLARQGAKVAIASRNLEKLEGVAKELQGDADVKTEVKAFQVDAADEQSMSRLAQDVVAAFGTVDILVNSQGLNIKQPFAEFSLADWNAMFEVNVKSVMLACREFGKIMLEKKSGKIINISSVVGHRVGPLAGNAGYCGTKGAVDQITRALAFEWASIPINVNAIGPSLILTEMMEKAVPPEILQKAVSSHPMGRLAQPEELIGACIFLASSASDYMTGQIVYVDGGRSCIV
jgi:NAD(P)-dependent dehydrogenase (short-subunit alcohol dehydrogenase family)